MTASQKGGLAAALAAACAALSALGGGGLLEGLELKTLDYRFRALQDFKLGSGGFRGRAASPDVVIVAIDELSLREFKKNKVVWKWPRDFYAALVRHIAKGKPKAIVFDVIFSDEDMDRKSTDAEETDGEFAREMVAAGNVLLAAMPAAKENLLGGDNPLVGPPTLSLRGSARGFTASNVVLPIPLFQKSAWGLGSVKYKEDPQDGVCRRTDMFAFHKDLVLPNLGLAAFLKAKEKREVESAGGRIAVGDTMIPLDSDGRFLIYWYGRGGPKGVFRYESFSNVIAALQQEASGEKSSIPSSSFRDKVVVIGADAPGLFDYRYTPFAREVPYPGMEIHATVISNLLNGDFLRRTSPWVRTAACALFSALICGAYILGSRILWASLLALILSLAWQAAAMALFRWKLVWLDVAAPQVAIALSFVASAWASYWLEGRKRRVLKEQFSRLLSPVVIREVLENKDSVELGGTEFTGTTYFSDLKDFTSYSEKLSPTELIGVLNEYFTIATEIVLGHKGLLDKYIGDAVMAVFGAPIPHKDHAAQACSVALDVQAAVKRAIDSGKAKMPPWITRIGINTGRMVVGMVGSPLKMEYTAIGDTVNLASRLEGSNKAYGTHILISASTYRDVQGAFEARELDLLAVKGKKQAVPVYELMGRAGSLAADRLELKGRFADGLGLYRGRDFASALALFERLLGQFEDDGPSRLYVERCRHFLAAPPPPDWDGSFHSETK